ncbi:hypothetical protein JCM11251_006450 [Rhodosporidiobolus azoricus]
MTSDSPPRSPAVLVAPATPDHYHHQQDDTSQPLTSTRRSTASSSLEPISTALPITSRSRSRSPSPSPTLSRSLTPTDSSASATAALVQAGLGLVGSLPPSPSVAQSSQFSFEGDRGDGDQVERLAENPSSSSSHFLPTSQDEAGPQKRTPSLVGFVEPEVPARDGRGGAESRGRRERKRSFIGLGFGGGGGDDDSSPTTGKGGGFARRISFGAFSPSGSAGGAVEDSHDSYQPSPPLAAASSLTSSATTAPLPNPVPPQSRKSSGPKALLRRAKSFGTSPVLASSAPGTFQSTVPPPLPSPASQPLSASSLSGTSPDLPLPRLNTSSFEPSSASPAGAALSPHYSPSPSGHSTPRTPSSPYHFPTSAASAQASTSTMVLPEAVPTQPHWLFMGSSPTASTSTLPPPQAGLSAPESGRGRRRSADEERARGSNEETAVSGKGKEKEQQQQGKTPKKRRATLGGLFGRNKAATAAAAAERDRDLEAGRASADTAGSGSLGGGPLEGKHTRDALSSLPPVATAVEQPLPDELGVRIRRSRQLPEFFTSDFPCEEAVQATLESGFGSKYPRRALTWADQSEWFALSGKLDETIAEHHDHTSRLFTGAKLTNEAVPVVIFTPPDGNIPSARLGVFLALFLHVFRDTPTSSRVASYPSPSFCSPLARTKSHSRIDRHILTRAHSASSPPALRRSNSYAPAPSSSTFSASPSAGSFVPPTRSPLSSPSTERSNPLAALHPAPSPAPSPSLAKTLIRTRQARSHSDASDRRTPSLPSPSIHATSPGGFYAGGRNMVLGGMGHPGGGGYFAQAHQKVGAGGWPSGEGRPGTSGQLGANGGGGGRASVFGSLGSFFHGGSSSGGRGGSVGMSRSSSAATATTGTSGVGTPQNENGPSEFGALFGGGESGKRSASVSRPGTGRLRGMSVGAGGFGSLFGGGGGSGRNDAPAQGSLPALAHAGHGRDRSGSASSVKTSSSTSGGGGGGLLSPPAEYGTLGGRVRALTDPPNRRFSSFMGSGSGSPSSSSAALHPPGSVSRPATADGATSPSKGNRLRGSSLSMVVDTAGGTGTSTPQGRPPPPREIKIPKPRVDEGETPEEWMRRLMVGEKGRSVRRRKEHPEEMTEEGKDQEVQGEELESQEEEGTEPLANGAITRALAQSSDPFHAAALAAYLRLFPFDHLPLDIALRVFLSAASLPSETQQIDRVMEAFARRWVECNPGVFEGKKPPSPAQTEKDEEQMKDARKKEKEGEESDIPYVLAFSMVMLNTDHFNPNAKSKMTKPDYVKNTRIDGLAPEVLEYLYDQITLAPFIFVDSGLTDVPISPSISSPSTSSTSLLGGSIGPGTHQPGPYASSATSSGFFSGGGGKGKGIDPYYLIATGQTSRFRVDVESHIPSKSPFSFTGTTAFFNATTLHALFARAPILQITTRSRASSKSSPSPHVTPVVPPPPLPGKTASDHSVSPSAVSAMEGSPLVPVVSNGTFISEPPKKKDRPSVSSLKITKIGLLSRKEDLAEGGKKAASRKWKGWTVVLTGSQLLFFKDPHFATSLQQALKTAASASEARPDDNHVLVFSIQTPFKPDAVLSLAQSAAIYDSTYSKYSNVFRLVAPAGRQYLFQAHNADDLNSWLHAINYAASFKTAGIRIRPLQPVVAPSTPSSVMTGSPRSSPAPASPRFSSPADRSINGNGHPQADTQLRDRATAGSPASTADTLSPKGSLTVNDDNEVTQLSSAAATDDATKHDQDESLATSLQAALAIPGMATNGHNSPRRDAVKQSPRPSETTFVQLASVTARADLLRSKIAELDVEINRVRERLRADLRLAKHLGILTPFKSSTRERVLTAIPPIEKRVRYARMTVAKLVCYREVLSRDLLVEDREAERLARKHSHLRTAGRRPSSTPRNRSPVPQPHSSPRHSSFLPHSHDSASLSQSTSSLRPPRSPHDFSHSDGEHTPRGSFDSLVSAFEDSQHFRQPQSLTDDELDRLQVRSPPLMQRSRTEEGQLSRLPPPVNGSHGLAIIDAHLQPRSSHHSHQHHQHDEDELEVPPALDSNGGAGTPIKRRPTDPAEVAIRGTRTMRERAESQEVLNVKSLAVPAEAA